MKKEEKEELYGNCFVSRTGENVWALLCKKQYIELQGNRLYITH